MEKAKALSNKFDHINLYSEDEKSSNEIFDCFDFLRID